MSKYPFAEIEDKWQRRWEEAQPYRTDGHADGERCYLLVEFPYPSGEGLHVGHPRSYVAMDVVARKRRMEGLTVLFPMGFDAFGLPAENYAIATGTHPRETTEKNIANFRRQLKMLGLSIDWQREVNTTSSSYYKWTQWIFLKMFEAGLAYKANSLINYCPDCKVALANEEVVNGCCERCGATTARKSQSQWMLRITDYADKLLSGLDTVNFIEPVVLQQRNWIGRSEGAEIRFPLADGDDQLTVFTTRPDTIFGATYMVISPEHPLVDRYAARITNRDAVARYREQAAHKTDLQRTDLAKQKTGEPLEGLDALNPATGKRIPIWISDYVLMSYGTGAIMAVPGHDTRDWEFAREFGLEIVEVVAGGDLEQGAFTDNDSGVMVNSGFLDGLPVQEAIARTIEWLEREGLGARKISYRLRDWVFSRQRYWGEPIPLVQCDDCGWVPVPEAELPLKLPEVEQFKAPEEGLSPLAAVTDWVETDCPRCGKPGRRETDTMPQWAGSCWYYIRYIDPHNDGAIADPELMHRWLPVDWYNGGMEHTTLHLLYSRFWHRFLFDQGVVPCPEPYRRRTSHGMILAEDNNKMSKSRGNVVNPDDVVAAYGSDTFRVFEMYLGAFDRVAVWSDAGVVGIHRFLNRVWSLREKVAPDLDPQEEDQRLTHRTIKAVTERIESMKFNTAVTALIVYCNELTKRDRIPAGMMQVYCKLLSPFAPHIADELWEQLGEPGLACLQPWPAYDPELARTELVTVVVQVNGKVRATLEVEQGLETDEVERLALENDRLQALLDGKERVRTIHVAGRLVNFVIK